MDRVLVLVKIHCSSQALSMQESSALVRSLWLESVCKKIPNPVSCTQSSHDWSKHFQIAQSLRKSLFHCFDKASHH